MTVGQLLANISSRELAEWQAYFRVENKRHEAARKKGKKDGKVTADDPNFSEVLKAQFAPKKAQKTGGK